MKKFLVIFLLTAICLFITTKVGAATITVCLQGGCDYSSVGGIQEAVEAAKDGDTILIQPGNYRSTNPIVVDPNYKFQNCLVHTRGKKLTIKGSGATLDNANGNMDNQPGWSTGICILGGEVTIDSLTIHQTLRPAIYIQNAKTIIKNVTFIDIDNVTIDMHQSQGMFLNNLFAASAGPGIIVSDTSYARVENNTFFGNGGAGVVFNFCAQNSPSGDVKNNIIVNPGDLFSNPFSGSGIGIDCKAETTSEELAQIKSSNNFVWKGDKGGCSSDADGVSPNYGPCVAGELCEGSTVIRPQFVGSGDGNNTVCVHGEGTIQGDFNTRATSPAGQAGAGISKGPCATAGATGCATYIQNNPLPEPPKPPEPPPGPGPGPGPNPGPNPNPNPGPNPGPEGSILPQIINPYNLPEIFGRLINTPNNIQLSGERTTKALSKGAGMDLMLYIMFSVTYIMFMTLAIGMGSEFSVGLMVSFFVFGGILGWWFQMYEGAFAVATILSLMFIGSPKKEM